MNLIFFPNEFDQYEIVQICYISNKHGINALLTQTQDKALLQLDRCDAVLIAERSND